MKSWLKSEKPKSLGKHVFFVALNVRAKGEQEQCTNDTNTCKAGRTRYVHDLGLRFANEPNLFFCLTATEGYEL